MRIIEIPIAGMDCHECTQHVQRAIAALPGVAAVDVFLASEKAVVPLDNPRVDVTALRNAVAEWATSAVVVFFMRVGDYAEGFTTERARRAVKDLTALAPQTARVERDGGEQSVPIAAVRMGDVVEVRPGEAIPVDGEVVSG